MNIHDYLIDQAEFDWPALLTEWEWLLPPQFRIWLLTRAGDLFIDTPDGWVHMLDVGAGYLGGVAKDRDEFCVRIDEPRMADEWLMTSVIDELVASGVVLGPGQCYSYRTLPALGGTYAADNRMPFSIREHFGAWGSVQRQISELPDGTQIVLRPVD